MAKISTALSQQQTTSIKQMQRLMMLPQMQQAMHLLQMPAIELAALVEAIQVQNPVISDSDEQNDEDEDISRLEESEEEQNEEDSGLDEEKALSFRDDDFTILQKLDDEFRYVEGDYVPARHIEEMEQARNYAEQSIREIPSLFEHLMQQAQETFQTPEELALSEAIIGNLSAEGYLQIPLEQIAIQNNFSLDKLKVILKEIQSFNPYGIGATSLQESLLIQLSCLGKQNTIAAAIIEKHFDDLLHNRIPAIQKGLGCSSEEITRAISHQISHLDLHPGSSYSRDVVQSIVPDVSLLSDEEGFRVVINDNYIPSLRLNSKYMRMMEDPTVPLETKEFIRKKIMSAKWLLKNIYQRNETLERIVNTLAKRQKDFFTNPQGKLIPLTMKTLAEELEVHESTIARAVANKYLDCPRGLLPLRSFFSNAYATNNGEDISSQTVRKALLDLISKEDKLHPYSDEDLSAKLQTQGIACARRTIAKYRSELKLGNAHQRRKYK